MAGSWRQYSRLAVACKPLLVLLLLPGVLMAESVVDLRSERGQLGGLTWHELALVYRPDRDGPGAWSLVIGGLELMPEAPPLDVELGCDSFQWSDRRPNCAEGQLSLALAGAEPMLVSSFRLGSPEEGDYRVALPHDDARVELHWRELPEGGVLEAVIDELPLDRLPPDWLNALGLDVLDGMVSGRLAWADGRLSAELHLAEALFDGIDGLLAGEGLELSLEMTLDPMSEPARLELELEQRSGEILVGPVYLPAPAQALALSMRLAWDRINGRIQGDFDFSDPGSVRAAGRAVLGATDDGWDLQALSLPVLEVDLSRFWPRWLDGPAAAAGFGGLETAGHVDGDLHWERGRLERAQLELRDVSLDDPRGRLALYGLNAGLDGTDGQTRIDLSWDAARLLGLPLGIGRAAFHHDEVGLRLLQPLEVPVLDGAVAIDGLAWLDVAEVPSRLVLDARIEPISLSLLTRELGLMEFGGTLAGRFPGVEYQDETLAFTGGIDIEAFSGRVRVDDLTVERPFGSLPALAAQVEFQRLDLLELTGAFDFGRMEGQMSGWARDLRLLDWRPVAMDARVFTHEDVPRRRISQRAVNNLSNLGGAGGAVLSGTLLRVFDDFPYRRAGLACRLSNNICYIDGVAPHESGGFLIVEGRGLPRLDVVGHRRLVDWPQLTRQLVAMLD